MQTKQGVALAPAIPPEPVLSPDFTVALSLVPGRTLAPALALSLPVSCCLARAILPTPALSRDLALALALHAPSSAERESKIEGEGESEGESKSKS